MTDQLRIPEEMISIICVVGCGLVEHIRRPSLDKRPGEVHVSRSKRMQNNRQLTANRFKDLDVEGKLNHAWSTDTLWGATSKYPFRHKTDPHTSQSSRIRRAAGLSCNISCTKFCIASCAELQPSPKSTPIDPRTASSLRFSTFGIPSRGAISPTRRSN